MPCNFDETSVWESSAAKCETLAPAEGNKTSSDKKKTFAVKRVLTANFVKRCKEHIF